MVDVAILYSREDRDTVELLDRALSARGWSVWWDDRIDQGDFPAEIERTLSSAKAVVPVWSKHSRDKVWVLDEARYASEANVPLFPVRVDGCTLPIGFGRLHTQDLRGWHGEDGHIGLRRLVRALEAKVRPQNKPHPAEVTQLTVGKKLIRLPCFLRSVSSFETLLRPDASLKALALLRTPSVLISAYDLAHDRTASAMVRETRNLLRGGSLVVLDSGNYEASRRRDQKWGAASYSAIASTAPCDLALSFDNLKPPETQQALIDDVVRRVERDRRSTQIPLVCPIVHAPRDGEGGFASDLLPEVFAKIAQKLSPPLIAIPERELGNGIIERARAVASIRRRLSELSRYQPIHLLGTGNPISMAVLSAAGADVFDGLEWCRTVADHQSASLHHPQHYDFVDFQTGLLTPDPKLASIIRAAVATPDVTYPAKVVFHNLEFCSVWEQELQQRRRDGSLTRFLAARLPKSVDKIAAALPEVFK
ncbi:toll/interleukin-1 receptor domain-containing protein [Anaeromyxobacter sp. Fw109-5]|uniref:toll/interleukin-1 receptor domain-containing protein n=1 Tax=Anaeromyxobacter sp. (strain Fw109-5) TaxID=404589 RepID=UPI000158A838|nr:toll/interleukin-1 receptor domain-containing protein [Anaeromyxobacter sp. Fw109-5]ABS28176.1 hypothetical protein Anae109_3998 [Anaeromyxobacter sp. Fw109-5]